MHTWITPIGEYTFTPEWLSAHFLASFSRVNCFYIIDWCTGRDDNVLLAFNVLLEEELSLTCLYYPLLNWNKIILLGPVSF